MEEMSFAAHVDFTQNWGFIERVRPANIVLVHGEKKTMELLKVYTTPPSGTCIRKT